MKTANLAIVFTRIEGFTERAARQTLEQNQRLLAVHAARVSPLVRAFEGKVVKALTDGLLITFESPTQAVLCGSAVQDHLWAHNRTAPSEEQLQIAWAVNVGEVRLEDRDVFGEPVNIAARVLGMAKPGEVYFAESVFLAMNRAEVPSQELGAFELKGVPGKVRLFQLPRAPADAAPAVDHPPFGNLGLARVDPAELQRADLGELGAIAAAIGGQLVEKTQSVLARVPGGVGIRRVAVAAGTALLLLALALIFLGADPVESAIDRVADAPEGERAAALSEARQAIGAVRSAGDRAYYQGRLEEALGNPGAAVGRYAAALEAGHREAEDRLETFLGNRDCGVRSRAADALGRQRARGARSALERLAEEGGEGDNLFCDSKGAARNALKALD